MIICQATLLRAWGTLSAHKDEDVVFEQWLVLCKVISHVQMNGNQLMELSRILSSRDIPFLDLHLRKTIPSCEQPYGTNAANVLDIDITGWQEVGEGLQRHVHYCVRYITSLSNFSKSDWEVNRRYSDFKLLSELLSRYEGSLIPPLPPKQIINSLNHDLPAQRAQELSLFLKNIARHPALYGAYEFRIFLEASVSGFEAFKALMKKLPDIEQREKSVANSSTPSTPPHTCAYGDGTGHMSSTRRGGGGYTAAATAVGSAAVGYAWGMWTSVNKMLNIPTITKRHVTTPSNAQLEESFAYTTGLLHALVTATAKMGTLLDVNKMIHHDLSRASHYMHLAADLDGNRRFDYYLSTTAKCINVLLLDTQQNIDLQSLEIYFHLQNLSRYYDVLKRNQAERLEYRQVCDSKEAKVVATQGHLVEVQRGQAGNVSAVGDANEALRVAEGEAKLAIQRHEGVMETTQVGV